MPACAAELNVVGSFPRSVTHFARISLIGYNSCSSADSRAYGTVPLALVQGRVLFRVWPLRGRALLQRGAPPRQEVTGFTLLPAGYEGQHIIKHRKSKQKEQEA
eukprot:scaffold5865_cov186-Amphora_coffeaeformis.AAC.15